MLCISSKIEILNINIHNLYPDLELTSPVYFSNDMICHTPPSQKINTGAMMGASFGTTFKQEDFKGALLYKLQRKYATRTDNQLNNYIASIEDKAANIYLLVVWNSGYYCYDFRVCLIEYTNDFTWDEDKLWTLYREYSERFERQDPNIIAWLIHGDTVVKTRFNVTYGSDYKLDIVVSEGTGKYNMFKPMKINAKRLVLSLPILIMLIYAISLSIEPTVKLNINNQCSSINLISPTYVTDGSLEFHRLPDHKVCAGDAISLGFISKSDDTSTVILVYQLQTWYAHESTGIIKYTSGVVHLLMIWDISKSYFSQADVLLVECDKKLDKDDLNDFYCENRNMFRQSDYATETWSLDDNTALMIEFDIIDEDRTLDIIIYEVDGYNSTRMPIHIDPKR
jgi:hypothetical protein